MASRFPYTGASGEMNYPVNNGEWRYTVLTYKHDPGLLQLWFQGINLNYGPGGSATAQNVKFNMPADNFN